MNKRIISILQSLADIEKEYTIKSPAEEYAVSERTIRNDLNSISELLRDNGLKELTLKSGGKVTRALDYPEILPMVSAQHLRKGRTEKSLSM